MRVLAYQHGLFPRSERVVAATRGLERGRVTAEAVEAAYAEDVEELVALQQEAGLDYHTDGLLRWQDIFRPLAEAAGLPARTLSRWFDNNAFYRMPETDGPLPRISGLGAFGSGQPLSAPGVATLPSPYLFSRAAATSGDRNALMLDIARNLLHPAVEQLAAAGCRLIHLQEPWLGYFGIDAGDREPLATALAAVGEGTPCDVVLHVYFGDAASHLDWLRRLPLHGVGVDLIETDVSALDSAWEIGLLAGCIDGRSSTLESPEQTAAFARRIVDRVAPPVLYVSSSCDLQSLPRDIAASKVRALGAAARLLRDPVRT